MDIIDIEQEIRAAAAGAPPDGTLREFLLKWADHVQWLENERKRLRKKVGTLAAEAGYKDGYPPK